MINGKTYSLPQLPYGYGDLAPFLSEEQLTIHHQKHHLAYVNGANLILEKIDSARTANAPLDIRAITKEFSFQLGGHILHSLFWENIAPDKNNEGENPSGQLAGMIDEQFGNLERFKSEFTQGAMSVEGSGWMALTYCRHTGRLLLMQIEKHNANVLPNHSILLVLDVFEHAYYIDYKNDRAKYANAFWQNVNWLKVGERLAEITAK